MDIFARKLNEVDMKIECDASVAVELSDYFSFKAPGYKFNPKFRSGFWDGNIRLFRVDQGILKVGLLTHLIQFAKEWGYSIGVDKKLYPPKYDAARLDEFLDNLNLSDAKGNPISVYDHQRAAVHEAVKLGRRTIVSPTASGKSLIIYCLIRWWEQHDVNPTPGSTLVIVPTIALVYQMQKDFADYSQLNEWDWTQVHGIAEGVTKDTTKPIIVSTWQSIHKQPRPWFWKFGTVIGDECHQYKADSIGNTCGMCINAANRVGLTGTLTSDGSKCNKLIIQGLFGRSVRVATTRELMDKGHVSDIDIDFIQLAYPDADRKSACGLEYQDEVKFIEGHKIRNHFVAKLAMSQKANTLLLFKTIKHGKMMHEFCEKINEGLPDDQKKTVMWVDGSVGGIDRVDIQARMEVERNIVLIASYGTFSTGINVKNIHVVIFGSPSKSAIRVLQSIGRGLRLLEGKAHLKLYDIVDLIYKDKRSGGREPKYCMKHADIRLKIYESEQFEYRFLPVKLG